MPGVSLPDPTRAAEAEGWLVASCLIDREVYAMVSPVVSGDAFVQPWARAAWQAMESLSADGVRPWWSPVREWLAARGEDTSILLDWISRVPTSAYADDYARQVATAAARRQAVAAATEIVQAAHNPSIRADQVVDLVSGAAGKVRLPGAGSEMLGPLDLAQLAADRNAERARGDDGAALSFGLMDLDAVTSGGARPGQLVVVGARPGVGKSSILRDMARAFARRGPVLFASNEMTAAQIADRDLSAYAGVPLPQITRGHYSAQTWQQLDGAVQRISETPVHNHVDGQLTGASLRAVAEAMRARTGLVAIVVDYLQRMADSYGHSENDRVASIAKALKSLALALDVPVITGSQLTRNSDRDAGDRRPSLADLRDSGAIEQEADTVLLLYRASYYWPTEEQWRKRTGGGKSEPYPGNQAEIIVAKQRQGEANVTVKTLWVPSLAGYRDLARANGHV